jgi:hypothetical protein
VAGVTVRTGTWEPKNRKAWFLANAAVEVAVLPGGGHIASIALKGGPAAGLNPLWEVPWTSMEPADFVAERDLAEYGGPPEGRLLASIMGHNLCLDYFGAPSKEEQAKGWVVHGETSISTWDFRETKTADGRAGITGDLVLPNAKLKVSRILTLNPESPVLTVETAVTNVGEKAHEYGWQEHTTFGPPFLEKGVTVFDASAKWCITDPVPFARRHRLKPALPFTWPVAPGADGRPVDLRVYPGGPPSGDFTAQLMDSAREWAWFTAIHPKKRLLAGYIWKREEFPWLGNWEENYDRDVKPWSDQTLTRGLEFGLSPFAHGRARMQALGSLHNVPVLGKLEPGETKKAVFHAFVAGLQDKSAGVKDVSMKNSAVEIALIEGGQPVSLKA